MGIKKKWEDWRDLLQEWSFEGQLLEDEDDSEWLAVAAVVIGLACLFFIVFLMIFSK